ncbi:MAG: HD domain-containing phosphohydrolase, partial [Myxococcota bacterium]
MRQERILILDIGPPLRPGFTEFIAAYQRELQARSQRLVDLNIDHISESQFEDSVFVNRLVEWIEQKYNINTLAGIVVVGVSELRPFRVLRDLVPRRTPIFAYIRGPNARGRAAAVQSLPQSFAVTNVDGYAEGVAVIWKVLPQTTAVVGIAGTAAQGRVLEQVLRENSPPNRPIEVMVAPTVEEVIQKAEGIPRTTAFFYSNVTTDRTGRTTSAADYVKAFAPNIEQPVFVTERTHLRDGVLGGIVGSPEDRGVALADLTMDVISGAITESAPPVRIATSRSIWREGSMLDFDISRRDLPPESEVVSWDPTVWERYPRGSLLVTALILLLLVATVALALERHKLFQSNESLQRREALIVRALSGIAETRDDDTGNHLKRTQEYVRRLAQVARGYPLFASQINETFIQHLYLSAPLHDIGKVGIPDQILRKAGRLTADEMTVMRTHTAIGERVLRLARAENSDDIPFLDVAIAIARSHHERWDGAGYPDGLLGE